MNPITEVLEKILTIDGKGRPAKALLLIKLLEENDLEKIKEMLKEISARKWF